MFNIRNDEFEKTQIIDIASMKECNYLEFLDNCIKNGLKPVNTVFSSPDCEVIRYYGRIKKPKDQYFPALGIVNMFNLNNDYVVYLGSDYQSVLMLKRVKGDVWHLELTYSENISIPLGLFGHAKATLRSGAKLDLIDQTHKLIS